MCPAIIRGNAFSVKKAAGEDRAAAEAVRVARGAAIKRRERNMPDRPKVSGSRRIKRIGTRGGKAGRLGFPIYDIFRYALIGLLCVVLAVVFQEAWLEQRDYLALERARRLMQSITPTPVPEPTPSPTPSPTLTEGPTPSPTPVPTPTPRIYVVNSKFDEFLRQNSDVVGWIVIADTPINYPVLQGDDNEYYLHHSIDGSESKTGSIFLDYRCSIKSDFPPHYIILRPPHEERDHVQGAHQIHGQELLLRASDLRVRYAVRGHDCGRFSRPTLPTSATPTSKRNLKAPRNGWPSSRDFSARAFMRPTLY
jgi:hypothetical protein